MSRITRRDFIKLVGTAGAASAVGLGLTACAGQQQKTMAKKTGGGRVVVVGGGFAGTVAAKYIRKMDPSIQVTLIEQEAKYVTCPFSNLVVGGLRSIDSITHSYDNLASKYDIKVVQDTATEIDPVAKKITTRNGGSMGYDRLVLSPGIDIKLGEIEGYDEAASTMLPHAWKAGPQTVALRQQLEAMDDGGVVIIAPPANPFRCPPGPYERAALIAHYLKSFKPRSKILILDQKDKFSKQGLFTAAWEELYPGMIEWVSKSNDGQVFRVDAASKTVYTEFDEHKGAVINIIPNQKAGQIAQTAGLVNEAGWCPVDQRTFESSMHKDIYVIGDACIAGKMPKSGYAANSQAKVCAAAIVAALNGEQPGVPSYVNTCYSIAGPNYGISVAKVYKHTEKGIVGIEGSGGLSPKGGNKALEAVYAENWYDNIVDDMFG